MALSAPARPRHPVLLLLVLAALSSFAFSRAAEGSVACDTAPAQP